MNATGDKIHLLSPIVEDFNNDNISDISFLYLLFINWWDTYPNM